MNRFAIHYFFYFTTYAVITPSFQVFLRARGFDAKNVGILQGVFALAGAFGAIAMGHLADRFGKRRTLLLASMVVSAAAMTPMNFLTGFWPIAALAVLFGVAYKSTIPLADALAASELKDPAHQYGRVRAWGSLGFIVMLWTISAFELINDTSSTSVLICFLATTALSIPMIARLPDHHKAPAPGQAGIKAKSIDFGGSFWIMMTVIFLGQVGMAAHYSFFSLFLKDAYAVKKFGLFWSIGAFCEMPMIFFAGFFLRRLGVLGMMGASLAAQAIRLAVYATLPPLGAIAGIQMLHAFTFGLCHTAAIEFIRLTIPKTRQGLAMTIYMAIVLGLAQMLGSSVGGHLIKYGGYSRMYTLHAIAPAVGLALLILTRRRLAKKIYRA